jgi:hypothetical protein
MNRTSGVRVPATGALLSLVIMIGSAPAASLDEDFRNPPEETKPWCYWYWLNSDITAEGITKDLESMAKVGIKRAMIGNIYGGKGVKMFSPQWYALTRHAFKEANRLSVDLMMFNGPGWSQSGGPWVKPEQSMRRVAWKEFEAEGGSYSERVRADGVPGGQDIAVLAVPRLNHVSIVGSSGTSAPGGSSPPSLAGASWIWHPADDAARAPAATRYFRRTIDADPAELSSAQITITADNEYVLCVNGREVAKDGDWETRESVSIKPLLKSGRNVIAVAVRNTDVGPAGLIATLELRTAAGKTRTIATDASWSAGASEVVGWQSATETPKDWRSARVLGRASMSPWRLGASKSKPKRGGVLVFEHTAPFTARALVVSGRGKASLYAVRDGQKQLVARIEAAGGSSKTDFLAGGVETFSFGDVTARRFELVPAIGGRVVLTSEPTVAQVIEKQMGRMHPTPSPTWQSYIFPDTVEPGDATVIVKQREILDLSRKLADDGTLTCTLPPGAWTILHFGMVTTGKKNGPAPREATGLEVDKMSVKHIRHHFNSSIGGLIERMTLAEKSAFKGITIDSYEVGSQNWTDGFAGEFEKRNGYDPIALLPVMTGRVIDSARVSDQFLWDLRRTVADMIAENYVGGLRDIAHEHGMTLWCENYGHWGFPGEFLIYGGYSDEIGGEFWVGNRSLGTIECRAASSAGHIYGKRRIYAEAFTSSLRLQNHPYTFKARGEELFCEGINHFVLHVYAHQPRDGVPGKNPWFGTPFHRNTPWFNEGREWVRYLQRCHHMLQQGEPVADVAVYIGDFAPQMTGPPNPVPAGFDYDYIGSDALLRTVSVRDGVWVVSDERDPARIAARYDLLAMPELKHIRPRVRARIEALRRQGGRVVQSAPVTAAVMAEEGVTPIVSATSCPVRWKARRLDDGMMFFLSNFGKTGAFEATLRVTGKAPELFDPVSGEITTLARYRQVDSGTRITISVDDRSDSFFIVFGDAPSGPSVTGVTTAGRSVAPSDMHLFYDKAGRLTAHASKAGAYSLTMSDGSTKRLSIEEESQSLRIEGPWQTAKRDKAGFSVLHSTAFDLPAGFVGGRRVLLDLGGVVVMAKVTVNSKTYDTLWMPPYELDVTDAVTPGRNALQVLVTSTSTSRPRLGRTVQLKTRSVATAGP